METRVFIAWRHSKSLAEKAYRKEIIIMPYNNSSEHLQIQIQIHYHKPELSFLKLLSLFIYHMHFNHKTTMLLITQ